MTEDERDDLLLHTVFVHLEVRRLQVGDELTLAVAHRRVDRDEVGRDPNRRRDRSLGTQSGWDGETGDAAGDGERHCPGDDGIPEMSGVRQAALRV